MKTIEENAHLYLAADAMAEKDLESEIDNLASYFDLLKAALLKLESEGYYLVRMPNDT